MSDVCEICRKDMHSKCNNPCKYDDCSHYICMSCYLVIDGNEDRVLPACFFCHRLRIVEDDDKDDPANEMEQDDTPLHKVHSRVWVLGSKLFTKKQLDDIKIMMPMKPLSPYDNERINSLSELVSYLCQSEPLQHTFSSFCDVLTTLRLIMHRNEICSIVAT